MIETAVSIKNLSVIYENTEALKNINLDVPEGGYVGIIGPNGGGKSTLLKAILGIVRPSEGSVEIFGKKAGPKEVSIGYVPQFAQIDKRFPINVFDAVLSGRIDKNLKPFFRYSKEDREKVSALLDRVGIGNLAKRQISELSGGEFQKTLIARALALNPRLLLLDEPTASVDASSRENIFSLLDELNRNMTIILVTHDLLAVSSKVKSLACLNGRLVYHGEPELNQNIVTHLYGCPVDLIAHGVPHRVLKDHGGNAE